ncbi:MAG: hypothetical protein QOF89_2870 [Acidobacteriota bacterium]|jgi:hypothetical protein|nr:hypothetical protein [Acidobacteriota bacterium]
MRFRARHLLFPALLLLGLAWALSGVSSYLPSGDGATEVMILQSLWHDHDLAYTRTDLDRAERLWPGGPAGLTLFTDDGGKTHHYGQPLAWPLAALPFYALLGLPGVALFDMALFLAMAGAAAFWYLRYLREEPGAAMFTGGFFFASAALAYAFRLEPQMLIMACVFFPLLIWQRLRSRPEEGDRGALAAFAGAGALLGLLLVASPWAAVLGLPILVDLAWRRRVRSLLALALAVLLVFGLLAALQHHGTGEWTAWGGAQRRTFDAEFPLESPRNLWQGIERGNDYPFDLAAGLRLLPRNLGYLAVGRFTGLLPYFPFALFALGLYVLGRPRDRSRHLLAFFLVVYGVAVLLVHPNDFAGAPGFVGSRCLAAVYPAFLFLPGRLDVRRSLILPYIAAGLWTALAVVGSLPRVVPESFKAQTAAPIFLRLPLELTLIPGGRLPGYEAQTWGGAVWIVPRRTFFTDSRQPEGVWVRGSSRSEVIVVSPQPISRLSFLAYSFASRNELRLDSGTDRLRVRFNTAGKREGTPISLAVRPVAQDLGFFSQPGERFYRLILETTGGLIPARHDPQSRDTRDLGVFLDFTPQAR